MCDGFADTGDTEDEGMEDDGTTGTSGSDDSGQTESGTREGDGASTSTDGGDCGLGFSTEDDFERTELGSDWGIVFPANGQQVAIIDESDLGLSPGPQGFFLVNWRADEFDADQFCEASIPLDVAGGWAHQVYVRWRESDGARYGFGYNNDPNQEDYGLWYFKYDGVPSDETRVFATASADAIPSPGDVLRVEIQGYTLRGYLNGDLVLEGTDDDPSKIPAGEVGLAARWAAGNQQTDAEAKVWEWWSGGDPCE